MSKSVFVSHATADGELVRAFVDFLADGIGVPVEEIFCSSLADFGIPAGQNFLSYMRNQMDGTVIVVMLISPSYVASAFCLAEMGAAWVKAKEVFPIVVPPATFADVNGVMLGKQAIKVDDDVRYNDLREKLAELLRFTPVKATRWDQKRKQFFEMLPVILGQLAKPPIVPAAAYQELQGKYDDALSDLQRQEEEIDRLTAENSELRKLKDAASVAKVIAQFDDTTVSEEFEQLVQAAKLAVRKIGASSVRRLYLANRYNKPFDIQALDKEDFDAAVRRNVLAEDLKPNQEQREVFAAEKAMSNLDKFIVKNRETLEEYLNQKGLAPPEPNNEDFWNEHLL